MQQRKNKQANIKILNMCIINIKTMYYSNISGLHPEESSGHLQRTSAAGQEQEQEQSCQSQQAWCLQGFLYHHSSWVSSQKPAMNMPAFKSQTLNKI